MAAPAVGPKPLTTFITPLGNPASLAREATYKALSGVCSAETKTVERNYKNHQCLSERQENLTEG